MQVRIAFVLFEVGRERVSAGNLAASVPDTLGGPATNVPELASGEPERIEVVTHLRVIENPRSIGACDDSIRHA